MVECMGENKDALMIVGIIVGIGIVWATTGGPARVEQGRSTAAPNTARTEDNRSYRSLPREDGGGLVAGESFSGKDDVERELEKIRVELVRVQEELDYIKKHGEQSPYKGMVTIEHSLSGVRQKSPEKEYIVIKASAHNDGHVVITGWRFESSITGKGASVPRGTSLPVSGSVNSETVIRLLKGERAYIATGRSPVGTSFRTNICTGHFEQFQDFSPALRRTCPDPDDELDDFGTGVPVTDDACYDYVRQLSRCNMVINAPPLQVTNACWDFVTKNINYSGCIANHRNDANFFGNEWRIFLGRSEELWRERREIIKLLDDTGKLVDTLTY